MFDANLLFSNNVNLSASGNSSILNIRKTGADGIDVELAVTGAVTGTTPTMDAKVQLSDSPTFASGVRDAGSFTQIAVTGSRRIVRVYGKELYARVAYTLGGTTPVFNGVYAGIVSGKQRDMLA